MTLYCNAGKKATALEIRLPASPLNDLTVTIEAAKASEDLIIDSATSGSSPIATRTVGNTPGLRNDYLLFDSIVCSSLIKTD